MKPNLPPKKQFGNWAEQEAARYLLDKGYTILAKNYRYKRSEIDIIAQYQKTIIFIEVKARTGTGYGYPEEAVSQHQQKMIIKAAEHYLEHEKLDMEIRFDIISILKNDRQTKTYHVEDAFY